MVKEHAFTKENTFLLAYLRRKIGPAELSLIGDTDEAVLFHAAVCRLYPPCWYIGEEAGPRPCRSGRRRSTVQTGNRRHNNV
jgi:hypothetical protein